MQFQGLQGKARIREKRSKGDSKDLGGSSKTFLGLFTGEAGLSFARLAIDARPPPPPARARA